MTWILDIQPQQEPFDVGPDDHGRAQCVFNVLATKRPSESFWLEIVAVLEAAGVGTRNVNIFGTSQAAIPDGDGPFLLVRPTGGTAPLGTHNDGAGAYRRPGAQILVTAKRWVAAEAMALAAYSALVAVRNQEVSA